jgi:hypothetical protein
LLYKAKLYLLVLEGMLVPNMKNVGARYNPPYFKYYRRKLR